MGSGLLTPGSGGTAASRAARGTVSAVTEHHLPPVSPYPLRPVDHQEHEPDTYQREPDRTHLGGVVEARWDEPGADGLAQETVGEHQDEPEDDRPDDRAQDPPGTAQYQQRVQIERHHRVVRVRLDRLGVDGEQHASSGPQHAAENQALQPVAEDILAEAAGGVLVLPDGPDDPAPWALDDQEHEHAGERHQRP